MIEFIHIFRHNRINGASASGGSHGGGRGTPSHGCLELVRQRGFASLPELAEELGVSESTVRRDLDFLEESGAAKRTHGGVFYTGSSPQLPHFEERQPAQWD